MWQFPKTAHFGKRVPKENFYQRMEMSPSLKRSFIDDIDHIVWSYKFSPDTLSVGKGSRVVEIELFELFLKQRAFDPKVIELIEKAIPKHLVFALRFQEEVKLWITYKEESEREKGQFKLLQSYSTEWMPSERTSLLLEGLNIDQIYEGFVRQVAGFQHPAEEEDIRITVEREQTIAKLEKRIAELQSKRRREPQFNRQLAFSSEIKQLQNELKQLRHG